MADLSITAANVISGANAVIKRGSAGGTVTAGQAVYLDPVTLKWTLADSNSATVAQRQAGGITLHGASLNQPIAVQTGGDITIGATLVAGASYFLSETPGGIEPAADQATGEYVCLLGLAKTTAVLALNIQFPGVVLP